MVVVSTFELTQMVIDAYNKFPLDLYKKVWATLQMVTNTVLLDSGNNTYKLPHMGKDKLIHKFKMDIPLCLPCMAMLNGALLIGPEIGVFMAGQ